MDFETVEVFWNLITRLEAQEMLKQFTLSDWPNMKNDKRQTLHRKLFRDAYPEKIKTVTLEEYMKNSGGGLSG